MNKTKLGIGLSTGMFFHAPAGTALPTYPTDCVGDNGDGTSTDQFTAEAAQTVFTLSEAANAMASVKVDGVALASNGYSVNGATLTLTAAPGADKVVEATYYAGAWRLVGDITDAGIVLNTDKSVTNIRNWANVVKRAVLTEHTESIQAPVQDTTEDALKTVVGSNNVVVTAADENHGKTIACNLSAGSLPAAEAFIFVMKDGDDLMAIGMKEGQITAVDSITFAPKDAIVWKPTITALGEGVVFISEEG